MQRIGDVKSSFVIPDEYLEIVQRIAEKNSIPTAAAVRILFLLGADVYLDMEKVGIPQVVAVTENLCRSLKKQRRFNEEKVLAQLLPQT